MGNSKAKDEKFILSGGDTFTYEECIENLKYTRDFNLYIDTLSLLKNRLLLILSVRGRSGQFISKENIDKIHSLGFEKYKFNSILGYVGVINKGIVVFDELADKVDNPVVFDGEVENVKLYVSSKTFASGDMAEIMINSENYSLNEVGLNFVVYDLEKSEVLDSCGYLANETKPTFFHYNLKYNNEYFSKHFYFMEKYISACEQPIKRSYFSNRKLNVTKVANGIMLPNRIIEGKSYGGVCDENFKFIAGHELFSIPNNLPSHIVTRHIFNSYTVPKEGIEYIDETVIYGGTMIDHPGHLLVECFADRIWWLVNNDDKKTKIAITVIWEKTIWSTEYAYFVKQYLQAFGIENDRIIYIKKPTKFREIIVPDQCAIPIINFLPYEFTKEYTQTFQHITNQLTPGPYKKIYLSKKLTAKKNIIGEDFFINFYKSKGFEIINPEDYTIKEKAALMYGAEEVVVIEGTNSCFSIFCKPSTKLTVLAIENNTWEYSMRVTNEASKIEDLYLVNVSMNFFDKDFSNGLSLIGVTDEFTRYVKDFYNEELEITPEESLKANLYEYLSYVPKYFSAPQYFNIIKNQKMLTVLQNISEVFLGKDFDTSKLDLSTHESNLQNQVKDLTAQKNDLTSKINALTKENEGYKSSKATLEDENKRLNAQLKSISDMNEALKLQLTALENTNKTLMSANSHLAQSMTEISSLLKNNTDLGE